ncbi:hypothetical protein [Marinobacter sp. ELB17]|uniref:hypothetical protein n=1 Tax=Marinobacter sp. ELB17 TaxID=270374 RepID=UPI0000F36134|nr:hypothetical protein [Marinobacter sp. ELB17]EAZ97677.1 hypothetical protein MELB17_24132 [Marinobacter sp. ELB17]
MSSEQIVEISHKLYTCRKQAIFLKGEDGFRQEVEKWEPTFKAAMAKLDCDILPALSGLLEAAKGKPDEGLLMHVLCAVGCELAEPSLDRSKTYVLAVDDEERQEPGPSPG